MSRLIYLRWCLRWCCRCAEAKPSQSEHNAWINFESSWCLSSRKFRGKTVMVYKFIMRTKSSDRVCLMNG